MSPKINMIPVSTDFMSQQEVEFTNLVFSSVAYYGGSVVTALRITALCIEGKRAGRPWSSVDLPSGNPRLNEETRRLYAEKLS